ncbi:hypothetical protein MKW98_021436 [Papaver atlanticum]|uniref:EF-hand domain-containing protein n=1 Tax=Papaver atlanticum TaxID=357466 RepID=A0AAD4SPZ9_9MAGN|nr:hypothetical protein MKW98_021436 [Papaver atlanticum]
MACDGDVFDDLDVAVVVEMGLIVKRDEEHLVAAFAYFDKDGSGYIAGHSRTRLLNREDLFEHLPALQQMLYRLIGCQPEGGALVCMLPNLSTFLFIVNVVRS